VSRHDPTLPRPDTASLPEADLIARVKTDRDSAALMGLVALHSGIYFKVVNRYAAAYPNTIKARDLDDDKLFNLDRFVCDYDSSRGTKLSTYIADRTDYLCKGMLKRDTRNVLSCAGYVASGAPLMEDAYLTTNGQQVTLEDQSREGQVVENADRDIGVEDIRRAAKEVCTDQRFTQILECRHGAGNEMSWREVAAQVGMSHEGCRKVYFHNLALVKAHLNG
jgi:hypothetical protein